MNPMSSPETAVSYSFSDVFRLIISLPANPTFFPVEATILMDESIPHSKDAGMRVEPC